MSQFWDTAIGNFVGIGVTALAFILVAKALFLGPLKSIPVIPNLVAAA